MGLITTFDSGTMTGWCQGFDGAIIGCGLIKISLTQRMTGLPYAAESPVFVEKPVYRFRNNKVDPNDLIALGLKVGRLQETYLVFDCSVSVITPSDWKGSVPKYIQNKHDEERIFDSEKPIIHATMTSVAESLRNNVWDAIGIYLWAAKKAKQRK